MHRSERRKLARELQTLMKEDGDRCTICRTDFAHNSMTYGGRAGGRAAVVGECCRPNLSVEVVKGLYVKGGNEVPKRLNGRGQPPTDREQVEAAIDGLQKGIAGTDAILASALTRAGISGGGGQIRFAATPWKADDAAWFRAHPQRSHRLRPLLKGEADSFPPSHFLKALPAGYEIHVIIRQIEPGQRARMPFGRNLAIPIPDNEAILHALFDRVAQLDDGGQTISTEELRRWLFATAIRKRCSSRAPFREVRAR